MHSPLAVCFHDNICFVCSLSFMCVCVCQLTFVTDVNIADDDDRVSRAFHYVSQNLLTKAEQQVNLSLGTALLPLWTNYFIRMCLVYITQRTACSPPGILLWLFWLSLSLPVIIIISCQLIVEAWAIQECLQLSVKGGQQGHSHNRCWLIAG